MNVKEMNYKEMAKILNQIAIEVSRLEGSDEIVDSLLAAREDLLIYIKHHQDTARGVK